MQKHFNIKAFLSFSVLFLSFFSTRLEAIVCQLCKKLEAHPSSFQKEHPNYFWTQPLSENESTDGHQLCQCCVSLLIAQNYDFVSEFFHEKCPLCVQESGCPIRVNPFKICVINIFGNPEGITMSLIGSQLKILVVDNSTIFLGLLPIIFQTGTEIALRLVLPLKTKKELFFGVICKESVDLETQSKILFGDDKLGTGPGYQGIQGFYNATVIIVDPASGQPVSYCLSRKPQLVDENRLSDHTLTYYTQGINCRKKTYFLSKPLD